MRMQLTKTDMARVIVQALYKLPALPAEDNIRVTRLVRRKKREDLERNHKLALTILERWVAQRAA